MARRRIVILAALAGVVLFVVIALGVLQIKQNSDSVVATMRSSFEKTSTAHFR